MQLLLAPTSQLLLDAFLLSGFAKSGGEVGERVEGLSWIEVREAFVFVLSYTFFEVVEDAVE